jgi:chromosomal replication initiator protein
VSMVSEAVERARAGAERGHISMMDPDRQIWDGMLAHLRANYQSICRQWFEELEPLGVAGGALQLRTLSHLHRDYLRKQCSEPFNDAARSVSGRLLTVRFLGPDDEPSKVTPPKKAADKRGIPAPPPASTPAANPAATTNNHVSHASIEAKPAVPAPVVPPQRPPQDIGPRPTPLHQSSVREPHRYESLVVNPDFSFDNFVVGPGNRLAHAAALAVAGNPGRSYNPYFVHGGVGLGKTHLLQAMCLKIVEANPRTMLYYTSCEGFVTQYFESVKDNEMAEFRHRFRDVDVLVIDDIHFLTKRDRSQEEFFHTFNALHQASKQIILSSDAPPEEIPDLEERLVSRFKSGLVAKMEPPCYETRVAILKTKAKMRGLLLPEDVACFLAARIDTNIRELEGAVVKLQITSTVEKQPITLELAKGAMGEAPPQVGGEPTIQNIITAVTEFYSIRLADLQSKHRQRSIALPRQVCMYLARKCTRHSLEEIGGFFGGRDHTTVMHALKTIDSKRADDGDFDVVVRTLEDKVRQPKGPA